MALIRNGLSLASNPARHGGSANVYGVVRPNWTGPGAMRGFYAGEATVINGVSIADTAARPNGYEPPYAWCLAQRGGGLSSYLYVTNDVDLDANLLMGINIESAMASSVSIATTMQAIANLISTLTTGVTFTAPMLAYSNLAATMACDGDVAAELDAYANLLAAMNSAGVLTSSLSLVVSMAADMASTGALSSAPLSLLVQLACSMLSAAATTAELRATANLASSMASDGEFTASLSVIAGMVATMTAAPTLVGSLRGTLSMSADMTTAGSVETPPSPEQIAAAVWEYLLAGVTAAESLTRTSPTTSGVVVADVINTPTTFKTDLVETATNHWKDALVSFSSGALRGQVKKVTAYNGTTKVLTVGPAPGFTGTPAATDAFVLINR